MIGRFLGWLIVFLLGVFISLTSLYTHLSTVRSLERIQEPPKAILQSPQFQLRASWYGPGYYGRKTANGEVFTANKLTVASRDLPFGTLVELCRTVSVPNVLGGYGALTRCIVVRVNDRGPYCEYTGSYYYPCTAERDIDVSEGAAEALGFKTEGVVTLDARYLYVPEPSP